MKKKKIKIGKRAIAAALTFAVITGASLGVSAATEHYNDASLTSDTAAWTQWKEDWTSISDDYEKISVNVGANESQLGFAFYQHTTDVPMVRYATSEAGLESAEAFEGTLTETGVAYSSSLQEALGAEGTYQAADVTITGLQANTTYYYQVYQNGAWGEVKTYTTKDTNSYSVLYVADPQIGACKGQANSDDLDTKLSGSIAARNDSYNWNSILTNTLENNPEISFIISAGDQVNAAQNEYEYAGFLNPEVLSSVALSTCIGNHDSSLNTYTLHYNNPNSFDLNDTSVSEYTDGHTAAGSDYYYTYGNVLYIVLDTNNYNCATHENVMKKAVSENPDCKWRVVIFHQDIYGSGADHSDSDGIVLRTQLTPLMDEYDIDVVLQGHDHTYSRSYQITSDGETHTSYDGSTFRSADSTEYETQNNCYNLCSSAEDGTTLTNPEGTVYFEQNSATGSKFYNLIATQQDFISERSQTWTPTYSIMNVTDDSLSITTYDATTNEQLAGSSTYTIIKTEYTGTTSYNTNIYTGVKGSVTLDELPEGWSYGDPVYETPMKSAVMDNNTLNYQLKLIAKAGDYTITIPVLNADYTEVASVTVTVSKKAVTHMTNCTVEVSQSEAGKVDVVVTNANGEVVDPSCYTVKTIGTIKAGKRVIVKVTGIASQGYNLSKSVSFKAVM